jgi:hypothetical protein
LKQILVWWQFSQRAAVFLGSETNVHYVAPFTFADRYATSSIGIRTTSRCSVSAESVAGSTDCEEVVSGNNCANVASEYLARRGIAVPTDVEMFDGSIPYAALILLDGPPALPLPTLSRALDPGFGCDWHGHKNKASGIDHRSHRGCLHCIM